MELQPIVSSNISEAGFVADKKKKVVSGKLYVKFSNGTFYMYNDVPETVANGFFEAESAGKFFFANIRNKFKTVRLEDAPEAEE